MAVIAGVTAGYMVGRLAGSDRAIVTTEAGPGGDIGMIKSRLGPGCRIVAILTGVTADNMTGCLAFCCHSVVTTKAAANDCIVVHACQRLPEFVRMALLAHMERPDMVCGLFIRCHHAGLIVADSTCCRSTLEHAAQVTSRTFRATVRPLKGKPG